MPYEYADIQSDLKILEGLASSQYSLFLPGIA